MTKALYKKLHAALNARLQNPGPRTPTSYDWAMHSRPNQRLPQGNWRIWLILAGRGFGKTRTGAETVRQWALSGTYRRICLLGDHLQDARRVMIEGASGLLAVIPPSEGLIYHRSQHSLKWPNGATATLYSGQAYENLRGPQFDAAWIDELAKFPQPEQAWDQLMMGLRLGPQPRVIITTTPRPIPLLRLLLQRPDVHVTRGSTFDNAAHLSKSFLTMMEETYAGSRLGRQEIDGELVDDQAQPLWQPHWIRRTAQIPALVRTVVAIDPAVSCGASSDETGIIVAGKDVLGRGYILGDLSLKATPTQWITTAVQALRDHRADSLIAEVNNGGDLIGHLLHSLFPGTRLHKVHATRSKILRAEPIAALYEQGRIFHVGHFPLLEQQMLAASRQDTPSRPGPQSGSPDRMDALVWALSALFLQDEAPASLTWI